MEMLNCTLIVNEMSNEFSYSAAATEREIFNELFHRLLFDDASDRSYIIES